MQFVITEGQVGEESVWNILVELQVTHVFKVTQPIS